MGAYLPMRGPGAIGVQCATAYKCLLLKQDDAGFPIQDLHGMYFTNLIAIIKTKSTQKFYK